MNGVPATIVIRHLMAGPAPTTRQPTAPSRTTAQRGASHSIAVRVIAPIVALAVLVGLIFVLALSQSSSDDQAPAAYSICRLRTADFHTTDCR